MKLIVSIAAGLLLTACATTTDTETAAAATEVQTADAGDRVCVREAPTGTRIPARTICRTQAEWDVIQARSQDTLRDMQRAASPGEQPQ